MSAGKLKSHIIYWFIGHPWLKLIALILAVIVWLYVKGEISISRIDF